MSEDRAPQAQATASLPQPPSESSIQLCPDGAYRWVYEYNLLTNPTILLTIGKVFLGIIIGFGALMLIMLVPDLVQGHAGAEDIAFSFQMTGIMLLVFLVLIILGYGIFALMQGGKYCVMFTMDENSVTFTQMPKEMKLAEVVGLLNVIAGLAGGKPSQVGLGIATASRESMTSTFSAVRSIKGSRRLQVIKVNEPLAKNQVYVQPEDYDFVFDYIVSHCPDAQVRS